MLSLHQLQFNIEQRNLFDLSLTFLPSSITYIKGANGCGKSSMLRMIAGIMQPSSGNIYYKNCNINNTKHISESFRQDKLKSESVQLIKIRKQRRILQNWLVSSFTKYAVAKPYCTYVGHNLGLKLEMTVFENLKFWSEIYNSAETLYAAIHYFKLHDLLDKKCASLSSGMQKVVAVARLVACQSDLWLLDEVETNLSKENRDLLNNLIVIKANSGGIVLLSSHLERSIKSAQILQLD
ncbi:ATP-binding cassette domain-containing protein [Rickettsia canadensis]|uniref:Cytochrome c biogenesis protein CcmA n=1 Tax=Rickettsia canadensis str. CA410 TaxID=1105107 RepID=A0ABM5MSY8_RICCA|nr:ATP-binding cassette domain-containing protein [Rickettsia canadensis]AFB21486.1 cytochrome c biogenesis protein CcmA [Rickettsia canadensis str. CA410]